MTTLVDPPHPIINFLRYSFDVMTFILKPICMCVFVCSNECHQGYLRRYDLTSFLIQLHEALVIEFYIYRCTFRGRAQIY